VEVGAGEEGRGRARAVAGKVSPSGRRWGARAAAAGTWPVVAGATGKGAAPGGKDEPPGAAAGPGAAAVGFWGSRRLLENPNSNLVL
jgi:hypothetical protein